LTYYAGVMTARSSKRMCLGPGITRITALVGGLKLSLRELIKNRDDVDDSVVDDMIAEYKEQIEGATGLFQLEEAMQSVFGLEPDYLDDEEVSVW